MSYRKEVAKIESTMLGFEDHGIFTAVLHVTYGKAGQGVGCKFLDAANPEYDYAEPEKAPRRIGTRYGAEFIMRTIEACGVDTWERVRGRTIYVLFNEEDRGLDRMPVGIENLPTEPGRRFLFEDIRSLLDEEVKLREALNT